MKRIVPLLLILILISVNAPAFSKNKKLCSVPFELTGSYVILKIKINDSTPLSMILDTGVRFTIINELMAGDSVSLNKTYTDSTLIQGLGNNAGVAAYRSYKNEVKIGKIKFANKIVLLLPNNVFNFANYTGKKINGILGADVLRDYIVEINYSSLHVNFYKNESFSPPKKYTRIQTEIVNNKLFIPADITTTENNTRKVKMLIDTGAELGAWLFDSSISSIHQKRVHGFIGEGLSGEILGYYTRSENLCVGPYCIPNPVITFPDTTYTKAIEQENHRDGTLGNQTLKRFNCIIDFKTPAFYVKPNYMFKNKFRYNVAGIEILKEMPFFFVTRVYQVWKNSPAEAAGVKENDLILEINGLKTFQMDVSEIRDIFETSRRFPLHIVIQRDKEIMDIDLNMNSKI